MRARLTVSGAPWDALHMAVTTAARGRAARSETPRSAHAFWEPPANRVDPVVILRKQARRRVPELVPIRHGRMLALLGHKTHSVATLSDIRKEGVQWMPLRS